MGETLITDHAEIDAFKEKALLEGTMSAPATLYHYTSTEVLLKILHTENVWYTHTRYLNDSSEFIHGIELFRDALGSLAQHGIDRQWIELVQSFLRQHANPLLQPFVFSLTENKDQLSQWRGYGDSGYGVSLGIHAASLMNCTTLHLKVVNVVYDDAKKKQIINSVLVGFQNCIKGLMTLGVQVNDIGIVRALALAYFQVAHVHSLRFKRSTWSEEAEWRSVVFAPVADKRISTRVRDKMIVPFIPISLPLFQGNTSEVVFGPKNNFEMQHDAVKDVGLRNGISITTSQSALTLR